MHKETKIYKGETASYFGRCRPLQNFIMLLLESLSMVIVTERTPIYINKSVKFVILMKYCLYYSHVPSDVNLSECLIKCYQEVIIGPVLMNR